MEERAEEWIFLEADDGNLQQDSKKEDFEVVQSQPDYEIIPTQEVRSLDESELEIHENYFLFGTPPVQDSDSEIEVLTKSVERKIPYALYSQVVLKNIENVGDYSSSYSSNMSVDEEGHVTSLSEEDDSEIEVVGVTRPTEEEDSLEIVFSSDPQEINSNDGYQGDDFSTTGEEANDEAEDDEEHGELDFSFVDDYEIKRLFEEVAVTDPKYDLISVKTSTLVAIFCVSIVVGVCVGSGCASLLILKSEINHLHEESKVEADVTDIPAEIFLFMDGSFKKTNLTSIWFSSSMKLNLKMILKSLHQLQREHNTLKSAYDDFKERYHIQKQMTWFWKKQVKQHDYTDERPKPKIYDGLMPLAHRIQRGTETRNATEQERGDLNQTIISNLKGQLEKERENTKYWKEMYTSIKLAKMRKCAKLGKVMSSSSFSFSNCLMLFSNVLPDFNITSNLLNLTKPVEKLADHVQSAWSSLKNSWKSEQTIKRDDAAIRRNVNRFRKIFQIGNIVNSNQKKAAVKDDYCADEAFRAFQKRWNDRRSVITFPKPESGLNREDKKVEQKSDTARIDNESNVSKKCEKISHGKLKATYKCGNDEYIEEMDPGYAEMLKNLQKPLKRYENDMLVSNIGDLYIELINGKMRRVTKVGDKEVIVDETGYKEMRKHLDSSLSMNTDECFSCQAGDLYIKMINDKIRSIRKKGGNDIVANKTEPKVGNVSTTRKTVEDSQTSSSSKTDRELLWYKRKVDVLSFEFDMYRWKTDSRMKSIIKTVEQKTELFQNEKLAHEKWLRKKLKFQSKVKLIKEKLGKEKQKLTKQKTMHEKEKKKSGKMLQENKKRFDEWRSKERMKLKEQLKGQKAKLVKKIDKARFLLKSYMNAEYKKVRQQKKEQERLNTKFIKKIVYYKTKYQRYSEEMKALRAKYDETKLSLQHHETININIEEKMKGYRKLVRDYERLKKQEAIYKSLATAGNREQNDFQKTVLNVNKRFNEYKHINKKTNNDDWRIPMVYCADQNYCHGHIKIDRSPVFPSRKNFVSAFDLVEVYPEHKFEIKITKKMPPPKPIPPLRLQHSKVPVQMGQKISLLYGTVPFKPSAPKPLADKAIYPQGNFAFAANSSTDGDEEAGKAMPLSWYLFWGKGRKLFNEYERKEEFVTIPLNWYITWMQSRDSYRNEAVTEGTSKRQINWYLKIMKDRETQRTVDVPMSWYFKWVYGRKKSKN